MFDDGTDPLLRALADLPGAASAASQERVRARCQAALARRRQPPVRVALAARFSGVLEAAALGTCGVYLAAVIREALRAAALLSAAWP